MMTAVAGALTSGIRSLHNNYHQGSLLVDSYWVGFYLTSYQDGFRRRALIGSLCRFLFPAGMNVILINCLAVMAVLSCLALFVYAFCRICEAGSSSQTRLWTFAVFASAFSGIFFEVLGDTLQIAFAVFCVGSLLAARYFRSSSARAIAGLALLCIGFFIHEASIFFLAPCIPFFSKSRPRIGDFVAPVLFFLGLLGLSMHWSTLAPHLTYHAILYPHVVDLSQPAVTPGFKELLSSEYQNDFGSRHGFLAFLGRAVRVLLLAVAVLIALPKCLSRPVLERTLQRFLCVLLFSLPLWGIAHDWGRFLCYAFFLAVASTVIWRYEDMNSTDGEEFSLVVTFTDMLRRIGAVELVGMGILFVLMDSPFEYSRVEGVSIRDFLGFCAVAAMVAIGLVSHRREHAQRLDRIES